VATVHVGQGATERVSIEFMTEQLLGWKVAVEGHMRPVMERVLARLNRGEAPPSVTLPESKGEFPKLLYLDMWVWVELSRVHYGMSKAPAAVAALAAIRDALTAKRAVAPIATTNLDEATKHTDEDRRKRLAEFMVDLCGNFSCLAHPVTRDYEIDCAVEKHMAVPTLPSIRPRLVQWGLDAAGLGRPARLPPMDPEYEEWVRQSLLEPEQSKVQLIYALDQSYHQQSEAREEELVKLNETARSTDGHLPPLERMAAAFRYFLTRPNTYTRRIVFALMRRGLSEQVYVDLVSDEGRLMRFAEDLHHLYIWTRIQYERDRSPDAKSEVNDARDGSFLGQAIAYGNIVVTEKQWAHLANQTKIAERYGTKVIGRLGEIPTVLKQEGCV
jgi:hypothetical protein